MSHDSDNVSGVLFLGAGAAALALGTWFVSRSSSESTPPTTPTTPAPTADPAVASSSWELQRNAKPARGARRYAREGRTILRDGVAVLSLARVDLGDQRYAITPHETDALVEQIVRLLNGARAGRRDARAKDPPYRERWLVDDRCGYRALLFWTGAPPETAKVGDVWAYLEKNSNGQILAKRRFRTTDEGHRYIKAALRRALERAGKHDCYDY